MYIYVVRAIKRVCQLTRHATRRFDNICGLTKRSWGLLYFFIKVVVIGHFIESEHAKNTRTQTKRIHRNSPSKADRCSVSYTPRSVGEQTKKKRKIVTHGLKVPCGRSSPKSPVYFSSQRTASQSAPEHHCVLQVTLS